MYQYLQKEHKEDTHDQIEQYRKKLIKSTDKIVINSPGSKSTVGSKNEKSISEIASKGISQKKYCELLYKIGVYSNATEIIELGTSFGIGTMYLASIPGSAVNTLEGCQNTAELAEKSFKRFKLKNIRLIFGEIGETLPELLLDIKSFDLAFIDANHTYEATLSYFDQLVRRSNSSSVIVLDDIYWSPEMTRAWKMIKEDNRVSLTLDLFQIGVVYLDPDLQKEDIILEI